MVNRSQLKKRYESVCKRAVKQHYEKHKLDLEMEEYFGFHFSMKENLMDNASIIDTLDYGTDDLSFKKFEMMMVTETITEANDIVCSESVQSTHSEVEHE